MAVQDPAGLPCIVVVGGGAGGAELATWLGRRLKACADVVLVDCSAAHLWKPRLHEVAAGLINPGEDEANYLALAQANGFRFVLGALDGLDPVRRVVRIAAVQSQAGGGQVLGPREIGYERLVLAFGSQVNDFGIEGVEQYCHRLDSCAQAAVFYRLFLEAALQAAGDPDRRLRVGIVGAGATGVELAAELRHSADAMRRFGGLGGFGKTDRLEITVVDMASRVLPEADPALSRYAHDALDRLGVRLVLDEGVVKVTEDALHLKSGDTVPCELKVWASGIVGHELAGRLQGLTLTKSRRIVTDSRLRCEGVDGVYALGDCGATPDGHGAPALPATAQVAHQQAVYLAAALPRLLRSRPVKPFRYRPRGTLVSFGATDAAGAFPTPGRRTPMLAARGVIPKLFYVSLQFMHRAALYGWSQAGALSLADRLRRTSSPPVKLH